MLRLSVPATTSVGVSTPSAASARAAAAIHFHPCELVEELREGSRGGLAQPRSTFASPTPAFARAIPPSALFHAAMRELILAFADWGSTFLFRLTPRILALLLDRNPPP